MRVCLQVMGRLRSGYADQIEPQLQGLSLHEGGQPSRLKLGRRGFDLGCGHARRDYSQPDA
jgi:hypothetical protein